MGRQIAVQLTRNKEEEFSRFLRDNKCVFIIPWSEKKKLNIVTDIPAVGPFLGTLLIWNKEFDLKKEFTKIKEEYKKSSYGYHLWTYGKPLIEYSRGPIFRIYWEKDFLINKPGYDLEKFEEWYDKVVKWIKKNCKSHKGLYIG